MRDSNTSWALLNLILCATGAILAAIAVNYVAWQKQREEDSAKCELGGKSKMKPGQPKIAWLAAALILGAAGVIVFLLTEDMRVGMIAADSWTVVNAVILAAELLSFVAAFNCKEE